jgi:hypothetical protein
MRTIPATRQAPDACAALRGTQIFLTQIAKSATNPLKNSPYQSEEKATYKIYTCKIKNAVCVKNPPDDTSKEEHLAVLAWRTLQRAASALLPTLGFVFRYSQDEQEPSGPLPQRGKNLAIPPSSRRPQFFLAHLAKSSVKESKNSPYE